jgi:hypothetical protein
MRDGTGALGASIIVHDVMLCFVIVMAIITIFKMVTGLVQSL